MKKTFLSLCILCTSLMPARAQQVPYTQEANRLIQAALADQGGWQKLTHITTRIGHRLSGSPQLEQAIQWCFEQMKADGLSNVRMQPVKVPHWVRGNESATMLAPYRKKLAMLGLGSSVGTPFWGIEAPVMVVDSFKQLDALRADAKGKIVVFNQPWKGYSKTFMYRAYAASRAAKYGAVAVLVRSLTGRSVYSPHTGVQLYDKKGPKIPTASITVEDARLMSELIDSGQEVRVKLKMDAKTLPDADSHNVMGEIIGRELPDEVVVLGGHIDSWDVGQGAHDDAAGVVAAWQAVKLIQELGLKPRRTIRVVAWTNEENGSQGGKAYQRVIGQEKKHVVAIEMDGGAEQPVGFGFTIPNAKADDPVVAGAKRKLSQIIDLLKSIGVNQVRVGGGGVDIGPLMKDGVPVMGLLTDAKHYFDWHHTEADTLDKVDPLHFRRCIATLAVMAYVLADSPEALPRGVKK